MSNEIFCSFRPLEINPNLSKCEYCGMIINTQKNKKKYICGIKVHNLSKDSNNKSNFKLVRKETKPAPQQVIKAQKQCSQENIDKRLSICHSCEFYQNNTCLKCGCSLSRDRVFMNKLYWPDQSCPIGKWGPIEPEVTGE